MSRKLAIVFLLIFLLGAAPILIIRPFGEMGAGFAHGFMDVFRFPLFVLLAVIVGFWSSYLGRSGMLVISSIFMSSFCISAIENLSGEQSLLFKLIICILLMGYASAFAIAKQQKMLMVAVVLTVAAFLVSLPFASEMPSVAAEEGYFMGLVIAATLLLGVGITLGLSILDQITPHLSHYFDRFSQTTYGAFLVKVIRSN